MVTKYGMVLPEGLRGQSGCYFNGAINITEFYFSMHQKVYSEEESLTLSFDNQRPHVVSNKANEV